MSHIALVCLGVFLLLFGLFAVTNIEIVWGRPVMGFAALVAGALVLWWGVEAYRGRKRQ